MKLLLAAGANPNVGATSSFDFDTPLVEASRKGDFEVAQLLLQAGANPNGLSFSGVPVSDAWSPLMYAVRYKHTKIAELLIDCGADVNYRCQRYRKNALYCAALNSDMYMVVRLLDAGANPIWERLTYGELRPQIFDCYPDGPSYPRYFINTIDYFRKWYRAFYK